MASNGQRRPPRPRIEMATPATSPEEAAAVIAAIEQFLAETAPVASTEPAEMSAWQRASLEEGVETRRGLSGTWGGSRSWRAL